MKEGIGNCAKRMACRSWRLPTGLTSCIAASAFLFSLIASGARAQAPELEDTSQSAAPSGTPADARDPKTDEKPADNASEQQKRLAEDKARLLKLATELKSEIDKAGTVALSVGAIRKADEIEKLARSIRQAMNRDRGHAR